ncbi:hypothetical protein HR17_09190 [Porphyromonas gulae]|uniref:Uncharacterized protein n=1 Tax=Porphyromonas gulae TaxID=111105 RepID=A0A0A2E6F3_9PORP|nr:hypothetical protein HR17_09190 [Porphyromonas gulae]KGN85894.1 hypothetical protein HR15_08650 [Porphyromonas gulae]
MHATQTEGFMCGFLDHSAKHSTKSPVKLLLHDFFFKSHIVLLFILQETNAKVGKMLYQVRL